jgi:acyl-CoA synthetase (AMP-forming)/AMP-acid ligase II
VELLPTSPTFLNLLLLSEAYKHFDLSSLKRITYGTEVMPARTLARLHAILPAVTLQQTYGLSELGILRTKSRSSDSLWVKLGGDGFELKVQDNTLWIRAQSAMLGYLNAPSPFGDERWFNTGDAVEVDGEYVRILGRRSEMINVGGLKFFPVEVENVLMQMPNVRDAVVVGEPNPITGQMVVARLNLSEPEDLTGIRQRVRAFCRERLAPYKIPTRAEALTEDQFTPRFKKVRQAGTTTV